MKKTILFSALALLTGCALQAPVKPENVQPPRVADRPAAAPVDVGIDWEWRVVGDAAARPVQVFDMNGQTYLQMRDRRPVVLLVNGMVVPFMTGWPYLVVQGQPDRVDVVIEGYRAVAERLSARNQVPVAVAQPVIGLQAVPQTMATPNIRRVERVNFK